MKRYIRLKNGRIIDTSAYVKAYEKDNYIFLELEHINYSIHRNNIVAESDDVNGLTMIDDLTRKELE